MTVGPEFSSQLIMLKESFRKVIIYRHEPGYFFRDLLCGHAGQDEFSGRTGYANMPMAFVRKKPTKTVAKKSRKATSIIPR